MRATLITIAAFEVEYCVLVNGNNLIYSLLSIHAEYAIAYAAKSGELVHQHFHVYVLIFCYHDLAQLLNLILAELTRA